jgi:hypothetical protein
MNPSNPLMMNGNGMHVFGGQMNHPGQMNIMMAGQNPNYSFGDEMDRIEEDDEEDDDEDDDDLGSVGSKPVTKKKSEKAKWTAEEVGNLFCLLAATRCNVLCSILYSLQIF